MCVAISTSYIWGSQHVLDLKKYVNNDDGEYESLRQSKSNIGCLFIKDRVMPIGFAVMPAVDESMLRYLTISAMVIRNNKLRNVKPV